VLGSSDAGTKELLQAVAAQQIDGFDFEVTDDGPFD